MRQIIDEALGDIFCSRVVPRVSRNELAVRRLRGKPGGRVTCPLIEDGVRGFMYEDLFKHALIDLALCQRAGVDKNSGSNAIVGGAAKWIIALVDPHIEDSPSQHVWNPAKNRRVVRGWYAGFIDVAELGIHLNFDYMSIRIGSLINVDIHDQIVAYATIKHVALLDAAIDQADERRRVRACNQVGHNERSSTERRCSRGRGGRQTRSDEQASGHQLLKSCRPAL
jgi:hypothetical protein